jgi:hypothetical protein
MNIYFLDLVTKPKKRIGLMRNDDIWEKKVGNKTYSIYDVGNMFSFHKKKVTIDLNYNLGFKLILYSGFMRIVVCLDNYVIKPKKEVQYGELDKLFLYLSFPKLNLVLRWLIHFLI